MSRTQSTFIEFVENIFNSFIFEKLLSHEAIVTGSVTDINNKLYKQSNAAL